MWVLVIVDNGTNEMIFFTGVFNSYSVGNLVADIIEGNVGNNFRVIELGDFSADAISFAGN